MLFSCPVVRSRARRSVAQGSQWWPGTLRGVVFKAENLRRHTGASQGAFTSRCRAAWGEKTDVRRTVAGGNGLPGFGAPWPTAHAPASAHRSRGPSRLSGLGTAAVRPGSRWHDGGAW
jgi:hypothetical protein